MIPTDEMVRAAAEAIATELEISFKKNESAVTSYAHAALTAALAAMWQPIETAPKDGTGILVKLPDSEMPHTAKFWRGCWTVAWDHSELKGWDTPTNWMPLPPAPTQLSTSMGSEKIAEG